MKKTKELFNDEVWLKLFPPTAHSFQPIYRFKNADLVRISRKKKTFEKGYMPNWSREVFSIYERLPTTPVTYKIRDYDKTPIQGTFYEAELQKVISKDIYQIESILQEKPGRRPLVLVKWKGYPDSMNSWILKKNLLNWS